MKQDLTKLESLKKKRVAPHLHKNNRNEFTLVRKKRENREGKEYV